MAKLPTKQNWDDVLKAVPPTAQTGTPPTILFTDKPAELLAFRGKPLYAKIPGTSLEYASNTESKVFLHMPDNQVYALISGRWFRAASLNGPWIYAGDSLPADFAKIPPGQAIRSSGFCARDAAGERCRVAVASTNDGHCEPRRCRSCGESPMRGRRNSCPSQPPPCFTR